MQPSQTSRSKGSKAARGGAGTRTAAATARANNTAAGADGTTGATGATQPHTEGAQMTGAGTNTEGKMPSNTQLPSQSSTSQQPLPQDSPAASSTSGPATTNAAAAPATTAPPAKRQRVSRACDQCRAMREKCDGAQPQCSSCVAQNRACTYKTSPKKRGVQTGYIRTLELTLSSLLDEVPGCADALDGLFGRHGGDAAQRLFNPEASASGGSAQQQKDLERHNRLHRRWHKSRARREINRLLSTDGFSAGVTRPLSDRAGSDEDTDTEGPASTAPAAAAALNRPPGATSAVTWSPSENTIPSPLSNTGTGNHADDNTRLPLPPNHWRLLDVYFSYTHCWFPILERQDVLKAVYQYERELGEQQPTSAPAQAPSTTSAASAELWSVLALASFQDAASRQQQHQHHPDSSNTLSIQQTRDPWPAWSPHRIYNIARQMIPLDDGPFEIQHARALLLLSLVNIGRRRYTAARVLIALSRQIVQDADCLSRINDYAHGPMSMRRRIVDAVTSGCCILEAFLSIVRFSLGQQLLPPHHHHQQQQYRSHQSPGYVSSHTPQNCPAVPEDGLDEWQPWVPCVGFGVEDAAASERSPAYSLTTFNQLHALFTFMQNQGTNASSSPSDYNDVIAAAAGSSQYGADADLDRVLRPDVPFSGFVRSPERVSAPVTSAYVLRITFVWMHILLFLSSTRTGGIDHARAHLLADVLEQFVARFGAAGAPPTLVPCVLTVVEHPSFKQLPPPLQQRLCALGDALEAVWDVPQQSKKQSSMLSGTTTNTAPTPRSNTNANAVLRQKLTPGGGASGTTTSAPAQAPTSAPPAAVVYQSASPKAAAAAAHHQQQQQAQTQAQGHHQGQQQRQTARHHRMSFLEQTQPHPPQQQPQQQPPQPSQDVNMYNGTGGPPAPPPPPAFGFHPLPISPPNAGSVGSEHQQQPSQTQQQQPPPPPGYPLMSTPYPGDGMAVDAFGGAPGAPGTLDYEALLDDLSAVDYLDRLDADIGSQFMANLGFAPGMDNNLGTMMGEFGGL